MQEQRQAGLLSLHALDRVTRQNMFAEVIPSQVVYSSEYVAWNNLLINVYRHRPLAQIDVPPIAEDGIILNLQGSARLSGKVARRFQAEYWETGNLVIIPKGETTNLQWSASNDVLVFLPATALLTALAAEISDADPSRVELVERINGRDPLLYHLGLALLAELRANTPAGDLYVESLTRTFGLHLLRYHAVWSLAIPSRHGVLSPAVLRRVLDYMREHLAGELTVEHLAQEANLSPYYFTRLFKQSTGQPLHQYVLQQRLDAAKRLLVAGPLSISEVAARTGFTDQSHLHRHFKRRYGITPGRVVAQRKNVQNARMNIQDPEA